MMRCSLAAIVLLGVSQWASAAGPTADFSALAVQQLPGQTARQARMFVTQNFVRREYVQESGGLIEIVDLAARKSYLLNPRQKEYMERQAPAQVLEQNAREQGTENPCALVSDTHCRLLGEEQVFGRVATKWEMIGEYEGRTQKVLLWQDKVRQMPLRQLLPDGTVTEMRLVANEETGGRPTEKWEMLMTRPDGQRIRSQQWFDTELQITIREALPGGYQRELRDIIIAPQDAALFRVPEDYQRVAEKQDVRPR